MVDKARYISAIVLSDVFGQQVFETLLFICIFPPTLFDFNLRFSLL